MGLVVDMEPARWGKPQIAHFSLKTAVETMKPQGEKLKLGKLKAEIRSGGMESAGLWISAFCFPNFSFALNPCPSVFICG